MEKAEVMQNEIKMVDQSHVFCMKQFTSEDDKASERQLFSEECTLVTLMSVVKGRIEATNKYVYFFDVTSYKENEERY